MSFASADNFEMTVVSILSMNIKAWFWGPFKCLQSVNLEEDTHPHESVRKLRKTVGKETAFLSASAYPAVTEWVLRGMSGGRDVTRELRRTR